MEIKLYLKFCYFFFFFIFWSVFEANFTFDSRSLMAIRKVLEIESGKDLLLWKRKVDIQSHSLVLRRPGFCLFYIWQRPLSLWVSFVWVFKV